MQKNEFDRAKCNCIKRKLVIFGLNLKNMRNALNRNGLINTLEPPVRNVHCIKLSIKLHTNGMHFTAPLKR